jgi:hypothetical protein
VQRHKHFKVVKHSAEFGTVTNVCSNTQAGDIAFRMPADGTVWGGLTSGLLPNAAIPMIAWVGCAPSRIGRNLPTRDGGLRNAPSVTKIAPYFAKWNTGELVENTRFAFARHKLEVRFNDLRESSWAI